MSGYTGGHGGNHAAGTNNGNGSGGGGGSAQGSTGSRGTNSNSGNAGWGGQNNISITNFEKYKDKYIPFSKSDCERIAANLVVGIPYCDWVYYVDIWYQER